MVSPNWNGWATKLIWAGVGFLVIVALASLVQPWTGRSFPAPGAALEAWTKWVASLVAIVVSARVFWSVSAWLIKRADA
jgi:hypothetical protein